MVDPRPREDFLVTEGDDALVSITESPRSNEEKPGAESNPNYK